MNLLAIDTSTEQASIALLANGTLFSKEQGSQKTHAQVLLPLIDALLKRAGITLDQLNGIVFGCGPGNFTGLRIACSIAKGLAYAQNLDLYPVSSLAALSWAVRKQVNDKDVPVLAVLDARMGELYWAFYTDNYCSKEQVSKAQDILVQTDSPLIITGTGIDTYWKDLPESVKARSLSSLTLFPSALAMIELVLALNLKPVPIEEAEPLYIRNQVTQGASRG